MKKLLTLLFLIMPLFAFSQIIQSNGTGGGDWNNTSTWLGGVIPTATNSTSIVIRSGDIVTIPTGFSVQADQLTVQSTGNLNIANGGVLDIVNGSGIDLIFDATSVMDIYGRLEMSHGTTFSNVLASNTTVYNGGVFRHKHTTGGAVILATWEDGSTLEFTGFVSGTVVPPNLGQSFYDVFFDCPAMTGPRFMLGFDEIRRNFIINNTGTRELHFFDNTGNGVVNILGDLIVNNSARFTVSQKGINNTLNIEGSFIYNSGSMSLLTQTGVIYLNISGDFVHTNPLGDVRFGSAPSAVTTINLSGNLELYGTMSSIISGVGQFNFTGGNEHNVTNSLAQNGVFRYYVESGDTLNLGTSFLNGSGAFTLRTGATLMVAGTNTVGTDGNGAIQNSTTEGQIRVPVTNRVYEDGSTVIYNGADNQRIGSGHPSGLGVTLIIDNSNTVQLLNNITNGRIENLQARLIAGVRTITTTEFINNSLFDPGVGTVIFDGGSAVIGGTGVKTFRNITVNSGTTLDLPDEEINIGGNFNIVSGAFLNSNASTLNFNGSGDQTINVNGAELNDIAVNKTGGDISLTSAINLTGGLFINSATNFNSNGQLTLLSTRDQPAIDAYIAPLATGADVVGDVTVQRYLSARDNDNRFISSPVTNATVAQLQQAVAVTGNFTGTSYPCTGCMNNGASLKWYDETITGSFSNGYTNYPSSGGSNLAELTPGIGFDVYMWNGVAPATINFTGSINKGNVSLGQNLGHTASSPADPFADGWNLVGNPYPSSIIWDNGPGWTKSNIDATIWVWDVLSDSWRSYNANTGVGDLTGGVIATGQAFWVYVPTAGSASLGIDESAKSIVSRGTYHRTAPVAVATIGLYDDMGASDQSFIFNHPDATNEYDVGLEAYKLQVGIERLSVSILDDQVRSYNHMAFSNEVPDLLPLEVIAQNEGFYELKINTENYPDLSGYYLIDREEEKSIEIKGTVSYGFLLKNGIQTKDRFYLSSRPILANDKIVTLLTWPNPIGNEELNIKLNSGEVEYIKMYNQVGEFVEEIAYVGGKENTFSTIDMSTKKSGVYFVRVLTAEGIFVSKVVKY
ncbi:T9SS type A sorting domain-containing protein [Fulvivirga sp. 29W222]|uniref:T9SS type A sorting domain-containing protein n=1 Tax=Fulvivirga marina TaxID=2494733 RepID=A0A937KA69_9BACT|nr:T9SS type A sorting domain-containing protein [Fulvivirga marina]MBL6444766.1 T9SS type A sorting domain-containing protein [Fulvivirga marina]